MSRLSILRVRSKRRQAFDPSLSLYLPLWMLDAPSFISRDSYGHLVTRIGALWTPQGHSLNGVSDRFIAPYSPALSIAGQITIIGYFKKPVYRNYDCLVWYGAAGADGNYEVYFNAAGECTFQTNGGAGFSNTSTNLDLAVDTWYQVAVTFNEATDTLRFFKNGNLIDTFTQTGTLPTSAGHSFIAGAAIITTWPFSGVIGEVHIISKELSQSAIGNHLIAAKRRMPWM